MFSCLFLTFKPFEGGLDDRKCLFIFVLAARLLMFVISLAKFHSNLINTELLFGEFLQSVSMQGQASHFSLVLPQHEPIDWKFTVTVQRFI